MFRCGYLVIHRTSIPMYWPLLRAAAAAAATLNGHDDDDGSKTAAVAKTRQRGARNVRKHSLSLLPNEGKNNDERVPT